MQTSPLSHILRQLGVWLGMVAVAGVAALVALNVSARQAPVYRASTTLLAETTPLYFSGLYNNLSLALPRLDGVAYQRAATSRLVVQRTLQLAGLNQSQAPGFAQARNVSIEPGKRALSDALYLEVDHPSRERAALLANAWAKALVEWNDGRIRQMYAEYEQGVEAQLKTLTRSVQRLNQTTPGGKDLEYLSTIRQYALRDLELVRALKAQVKGPLSLLDPAQTRIISPRPRFTAALVGLGSFILLALLWLAYKTWEQTIRAAHERRA